MKYIFLLFLIYNNSFSFEKVLKGAEFKKNENIPLFILPINCNSISAIKVNSRVNFFLNQKSNLIAICDGQIIQLDKQLGYLKIQSKSQKEIILIRYFNVKNICKKEGDQIKKGEILGFVEESFAIQVMINDIIINFFEYISKEQKKQMQSIKI